VNSGLPSGKIDLKKLVFKPLDSTMDRAVFCCGEPELDEFFRDNAGDHHDRYLARVTVALYDGQLVGYYWLVAQSHSSGKLSEEAMGKLERIEFAPCVYLGMIGIMDKLQGNGIGKALMLHAFAKTLQVAEHIGVYALTLEAINEDKAATYARWGFTPFIDGELLMFIPLATIREALFPSK
jgi:GNAT superfamily N-acetyltransferase